MMKAQEVEVVAALIRTGQSPNYYRTCDENTQADHLFSHRCILCSTLASTQKLAAYEFSIDWVNKGFIK
jgi:hypothetical protein